MSSDSSDIWQLQEAKARFSEVVELALHQGPQHVTRHSREAVVILSVDEYRRLKGQTLGLMDCLLRAPRGKALTIERRAERIRDVAL